MRTLLLFLLLSPFLFSKFQTVSVGTIDQEYQGKLTKEQIYTTLMQIKEQFETQLGYDVFTYAKDGKPINIVYLKPSVKKRKILTLQKKISTISKKLKKLELKRTAKQQDINKRQKSLNAKYTKHNKKVHALNSYIQKLNNQYKKGIPKEEYKSVKHYVDKEQAEIKESAQALSHEKQTFKREFNKLKRQTSHYNQLIRKYNRLIRDKERLTKNFIEVKGVTKSNIKTTYVTTIKGGKRSVTKSSDVSMDKIEIYDFETLEKFKVVLAHELGHLVGVEHVGAKGALMNPLMQDAQVEELFLTPWDIEGFNKAFGRKR